MSLPKDFNAGSILLLDKPLHWTSFDLVKKIRNITKAKKVGHAGTLDPLATGLLIICTGPSTKLISGIQDAPKQYEALVRLGETRPSYDLETEVSATAPWEHITKQDVVEALKNFTGIIMQKPPIYSAIKIKGDRAYDLARKGEAPEMEARPVTISSLTLTGMEGPVLSLKIDCSKGTYIRSLAHDLGQALGCGAALIGLRRTAIGEYTISDALSIESLVAHCQLIKASNTHASL
jgi:tRNA pseudouridine55 synthase